MCGSTVFQIECRKSKSGLVVVEAVIMMMMTIMTTMILPWQTRVLVSLLLSAEIPNQTRARATPSCPLAPENAKYPLPWTPLVYASI